jgi:purine-nucleoside phosphorylase
MTMTMTMTRTMTAVDVIQRLAPEAKPRIGIVLGSGWGGLAAQVQQAQRIPYTELPGFPVSAVAGHSSELTLGRIGAHEVAVLGGRKHTYETGEADAMKTPLRTLRALGCDVLVQTNAAGSLNASMPPGSLMVLSDHINFSQRSPLMGESGSEKFVSMVDAYDPALRACALSTAQKLGVHLHAGVYVWFVGPQFETPAEIRMFQSIGANAVGMSTVPETIIARHAGMRVLAFSLLTNMAAGLSDEKLSHAHTLAQAKAASEHASGFLVAAITALEL